MNFYCIGLLVAFVHLASQPSCAASSNPENNLAHSVTSLPDTPELRIATPPFPLQENSYRFYQDIAYGKDGKNVFDLFIPQSKQPVPLVIYIHGGGFSGGDKAKPYPKSAALINALLGKKIAFASINYRLLRESDGQGVFKCLNDCKRALQYIRYFAKNLHVDANNIVLMGGSAGAGASLWIGLNDEMAERNSPDPISRMSTRVQGIVALLTQASYDILEWHNDVFREYQLQGFDENYIIKMATEVKVLKWYGFNDSTDLQSAASRGRRNRLNMLHFMSPDDPEIYVENTGLPYIMPTTPGVLNHHALHAKALMDQAGKVNLAGKFFIPKMDIDTRNGETTQDFLIRILRKQ